MTAKGRVSKLKAELEELKAQENCRNEKKGKGCARGEGPAALAELEEKVARLEAMLTEAEGQITKGTLAPKNIRKLKVCEILLNTRGVLAWHALYLSTRLLRESNLQSHW